jgi:O-antigen ligase
MAHVDTFWSFDYRTRIMKTMRMLAPFDLETEPFPGWRLTLDSARFGVVGIFCFLTPIFFLRLGLEPFNNPKTWLLETGAMLLLGLSLPGWMSQKPRLSLMSIGMTLWIGSILIATFTADLPLRSWIGQSGSDFGTRTVLSLGLIFLVSRETVNTQSRQDRICQLIIVSGIISSLYALVQFFRLDPFTWSEVSRIGNYERPFGTFAHPNHLAGYLLLAIPLAIQAFRNSISTRSRFLYLGAIGLMFCILVATRSRGAWMAGIGMLLFWGWCQVPRLSSKLVLASVFLGMFGILCMIPATQQKLSNVLKQEGRIHHANLAMQLFQEHPILGVGWERFGTAATLHRSPELWVLEPDKTPVNAHNLILQTAATAGFIGLIGLAGVLLATTITMLKHFLTYPAIIVGLIGIFLHLQLSFFEIGFALPFFVLLGSLVERRKEIEQPMSSTRTWACVGFTGIVLICLVTQRVPSWHAQILAGENDVDSMKQALRLDPTSLTIAQAAGRFFDQRNRPEQAEAALEHATKLDPQDGANWANLARVRYRTQGPNELTFKTYEHAVQCEPYHPKILAEAAETAIQLKNYSLAGEWIKQLRLAFPDSGPGAMLEMERLWQLKQNNEALELTKDVIEGNWFGEPDSFHQACRRVGQLWLTQGNWLRVIDLAGGFAANWPEDPIFERMKAIAFEKGNFPYQAGKAYEAALKLDPNHVPTIVGLQRIKMKR